MHSIHVSDGRGNWSPRRKPKQTWGGHAVTPIVSSVAAAAYAKWRGLYAPAMQKYPYGRNDFFHNMSPLMVFFSNYDSLSPLHLSDTVNDPASGTQFSSLTF